MCCITSRNTYVLRHRKNAVRHLNYTCRALCLLSTKSSISDPLYNGQALKHCAPVAHLRLMGMLHTARAISETMTPCKPNSRQQQQTVETELTDKLHRTLPRREPQSRDHRFAFAFITASQPVSAGKGETFVVDSSTVANELTVGGKLRGGFLMPPPPGPLRRGPPWREGEIAKPGLGR